MIKSALCLLLFLLFVFMLPAQTNSKKARAIVNTNQTAILSDSSVIIPTSLIIFTSNNKIVPPTQYQFDFSNNSIQFLSSDVQNGDTIQVVYNTIHLFQKGIFSLYQKNKDSTSAIIKNPSVHQYFDIQRDDKSTNEELQKSGSISRGFSIGNRQDLGLNSSLNLQLQGKLNDLNILASISDNNLPVQPDGTSAKIQEFDKIFIRLSKNNTSLLAGDINIQAWPDPMFLKFRRNVQGIEFSSQQKNSSSAGNILKYRTYLSAAKGKFNRQTLTVIDGVSGPYRLYGAENEQYIVVIAGSEQVFIDGKKMNRGLDADYIIDYNTAEIRFMPSVSITIHSRVIIEFEYSDKKFVRTLWGTDATWSNKKTRISAGFISEGDMKNQPLQQTLSDQQKNKLFLGGENFPIYERGIDTLKFSNDRVMYRLIDTLGYDSVLVFSTDSTVAKYTAVFSYVGSNKGNYKLAGYNINGRTYEWIEPVGMQKQGDYEPVSILYAPQRKTMLYTNISQQLNNRLSLCGDYAYSNSDNNTFSPYGNINNRGVAANIQLKIKTGKSDSTGKSKSEISIYQRFIEYTFSPIDRFENVEFDREWNLNLLKPTGNQWRRGVLFITYPSSEGQHQVQLEQLSYNKGFNAFRFSSNNQVNTQTWIIGNIFSGNSGTIDNKKFKYLKNTLKIQKKIKNIKIGAIQSGEYNNINIGTDSIIPGSFSFIQGEAFISFGDSSTQSIKIFQRGRYDEKPLNNTLKFFSRNYESGIMMKIPTEKIDRLQVEALYRKCNYAAFAGQNNEKTLNARIDYADSYWAKLISSTFFFEMSNGTEAKKEYSFIEVLPGSGTHTWIDLNSNGIKELSEFIPAIYSDQANYIRIVLPVNEYIKTYLQSASGSLIFDGSRIKSKNLYSKAIRLFYNRINGTFSSSTGEESKRLFSLFRDDSLQISSSRLIRNFMIFNKNSSVINFSWEFQKGDNLSLSVNGNEKRTRNKHDFKLLWNINRNLMIEPSFGLSQNKALSVWAPSNNYKIMEQTAKSVFSYQRESRQRVSIGFEYSEKNNTNDTSRSINRKLFGEYRLSKAGTAGITFRYTVQQISYNGSENTAASYQMLEGLKPGTNHLWTITLQMMISKNLQIGLNYEGRAPENSTVIHVGSIQLRAIL